MQERYPRTESMAVLLITTDASPPHNEADFAATSLGASLRAQTCPRWTLDRGRRDIKATISVDRHSVLHERAVATVLDCFDAQPEIDLLIADAIVDGRSRRRSAWSPAGVISQPHELDLLACRGSASMPGIVGRIQAVTGPAAQPWHLPAPLVRRTGSCGHSPELDAAIAAFVTARMPGSEVSPGPREGTYVVQPTPDLPPTTVIIATAGTLDDAGIPLVHRAIAAVNATGTGTEIVLVVGDEYLGDPTSLAQFDSCRLVRRPPGPWSFSASVNLGLLTSPTDHILLLNDDIEHLDTIWLQQLSSHLNDSSVGAVGALLFYPDRTVQHIGMITDDAYPLHSFVGVSETDLSVHGMDLARDAIAVTGACLLARRRDLLQVGGLNPALPYSFNDADLCLKLHRHGLRVVIEPAARLIHHEGASRPPVIQSWEWDRFVGRWGEVVDPWYHPAHHRPDDPHNRRANADHLAPRDIPFITIPRRADVRSRVHHCRMQAVTALDR